MANPVDEYLRNTYGYSEEIIKAAADQAKWPENKIQDILEWQRQDRLVDAGEAEEIDPELNERVHGYLEPTRRSALRRHKAPLAGEGLETRSRTLTPKILRKWDPTKGASPTTLAHNEYRRLHRENLQQHSIRGTEADAKLFSVLDEVKGELEDELGEEPSQEQILARMNEHLPANKRIDATRLQELDMRRGGSALSSGFESSPTSYAQNIEQQKVDLARYDLKNEQDREVYDRVFGQGGKRQQGSTGAIAKDMGISDPTVSRSKGRILEAIGVPAEQRTRKRGPLPMGPAQPPPALAASATPSMGPSVLGRLGKPPKPPKPPGTG